MSFMVVNTGRAASRAFYLNLSRQADVRLPSRHEFDDAVTRFILHDDATPMYALAESVRTTRLGGKRTPIVFHGVRPRLDFPFTSAKNVDLLGLVRDQFEIGTVHLVVRDAVEVLRSELNRRLALAAGDWAFPAGGLWRSRFTPQQIVDLDGASDPVARSSSTSDLDLTELLVDVAVRTGRVRQLDELFRAAFDDVRVSPYADFMTDPRSAMNALFDDKAALTDTALLAVKLNSVANRFLVYNPIVVDLPGGSVRYRFELRDVIGHCRDWGELRDLEPGRDRLAPLRPIEEDLGAELSLAVVDDDLRALPPSTRQLALDDVFIDEVVRILAPIFVENFRSSRAFYKDLYIDEIPVALQERFLELTADDCPVR